jgi:maltose alpha-D-glucosyltransferase/alpha-amylase
MRDLAGILRSFSYAKWSALKRAIETEPAMERMAALLEAWEADTRKAFIAAYASAVQGSGIYPSFDDARGLLELAELEKLLYEVRYEQANRPDWLHIPLQGLQALLRKV